jgi:hypothetical protein
MTAYFFLIFSTFAFSQEIVIRVPYFSNLLTIGGELRCVYPESPAFGYLFRRLADNQIIIDVINKGESEGEKTRMVPEEKSYGSPFIHYLSVYKRSDNYGSYLEFLLDQKLNTRTGKYLGYVMFTEAFYERIEGREVETLKPMHKKPLDCTVKN